MDLVHQVTQCRSCGSRNLSLFLDLGETPIANALVDPADPPAEDPTYPLDVVFCNDCTLVQLGHILPANAIFDEDYPYYSSFSQALIDHAGEHVDALVAARGLGPDSLAVEVASNDGYLLQHFVRHGVPVLGIDPSPGPAGAANDKGIPTLVEFFGCEAATRMVSEHGQADVILANNVMAHIPDLNDFVGGFAILLKDDGVLTVENPYVRDLVEHVEFDTIYHEHYYYYSCTAVDRLMRRHGMFLNDVAYFKDLHGGTLRWYIGKRDERTDRCADYLRREEESGMTAFGYYADFSARVTNCQTKLVALLNELAAQGRRVAAYGAAAKGATLLNSSGVKVPLIEYVVDRNFHKQGKLMPGCRLPIRPVEDLVTDRPDDLLLLAWNFAIEIQAQQQEYAALGGRFLVPVPEVHPI